jgi:DNA-binding MarR family transcriptional regulator
LHDMTSTRRRVGRRARTELRFLILAAQREGHRALSRFLKALDVTPAQAEILLVLATYEPLTLAEVGRLIVSETTSPSRIVEGLIRLGLVEREPGQLDRRVVQLALTEAGRLRVPKILKVDQDMDEQFLGQLTEEEAALIGNVMRKMLKGTPSGEAVEARFGPAPD